jgi:hypothetical protein
MHILNIQEAMRDKESIEKTRINQRGIFFFANPII